MATDHPRDQDGRITPDPSWPPGRRAPGDLEFLRRYLNTSNRENGADRCATPLGIGEFLQGQGRPAFLPEPDEHARLVGLRESLHAMVVARPGPGPAMEAVVALDQVELGVESTDGGLAVVARGDTPARRLVSDLARIVVVHAGDGTWARLTACAHCRWVVYDASRNRSGRWCSMGLRRSPPHPRRPSSGRRLPVLTTRRDRPARTSAGACRGTRGSAWQNRVSGNEECPHVRDA